jgi:copper chaperone CopZ
MRVGKKNSRRIIAAVAFCALAAAGASGLITRAGVSTDATATTAPARNGRVVITIEGMHCGGCASGIKAMLKRTEGVVSADVSYERKEAVVEYDPGRTTREKIVEAIANMGYKASIRE